MLITFRILLFDLLFLLQFSNRWILRLSKELSCFFNRNHVPAISRANSGVCRVFGVCHVRATVPSRAQSPTERPELFCCILFVTLYFNFFPILKVIIEQIKHNSSAVFIWILIIKYIRFKEVRWGPSISSAAPSALPRRNGLCATRDLRTRPHRTFRVPARTELFVPRSRKYFKWQVKFEWLREWSGFSGTSEFSTRIELPEKSIPIRRLGNL